VQASPLLHPPPHRHSKHHLGSQALRYHQYYTNQITLIKRLVRTNSSFAVLWQQRLVDRKEKLEKEFPTLKDSK